MTKPYEKPTDELRQVRHVYENLSGPSTVFYTVQRKWLVQDGEKYESMREGSLPGEVRIGHSRTHHFECSSWGIPTPPSISYSWFCKVKEIWRDLPVVTAEAVSQETTK